MARQKKTRRSQADRRAETRAKLIAAGRSLFVANGFASTSTPDLVTRAGVTRGALYHHFDDKTDLFRAVAHSEAEAVATLIDRRTRDVVSAQEAMFIGTSAYFEAMAVAGRVRLLLEEAPAVLGHDEAIQLTRNSGTAELREGLSRALPDLGDEDTQALTKLLSAAFDRAALEIAYGGDPATYREAMLKLIGSLLGTHFDES